MDPSRQLRRMVNGFQVSQAIHVAAALGISDLLATEPRNVADLARDTGTHAPTLTRLMRALESVGVYATDDTGRYVNTELSDQLRSDVAGSLLGWAAFVGRPPYWQAWAGLIDSVRTGANSFATVHGVPVWEYRRQHPEDQDVFDRAMTTMSGVVAQGVIDSYDFSRFDTVVDVGGGAGGLLGAILARCPDARGVLFDQPGVVAGAAPLLKQLGVGERCEVVGGSFFDALPPGVTST
jgi:hypothetical protein